MSKNKDAKSAVRYYLKIKKMQPIQRQPRVENSIVVAIRLGPVVQFNCQKVYSKLVVLVKPSGQQTLLPKLKDFFLVRISCSFPVFPRLDCAHSISFTLLSRRCSIQGCVVFEGAF